MGGRTCEGVSEGDGDGGGVGVVGVWFAGLGFLPLVYSCDIMLLTTTVVEDSICSFAMLAIGWFAPRVSICSKAAVMVCCISSQARFLTALMAIMVALVSVCCVA